MGVFQRIRDWFGSGRDDAGAIPRAGGSIAAITNINMVAWSAVLSLILFLVTFGQSTGPEKWNVFLVAMGSAALGALLGFLYGSFGEENERFKPFFNLFNGLIGGALLTDLLKGDGSIALRYVSSLAVACGYCQEGAAIVTMIALAYGAIGFLSLYYNRKLLLNAAAAAEDRRVRDLDTAITQTAALEAASTEAAPDPRQGHGPTPSQVHAAQQVWAMVPHDAVGIVRKKLAEYAAEYEAARERMPPGDARTRQLEVVVSKMRTVALAARPLLDQLARSPSAGERLAAIAILQIAPDPDRLEWLADRVAREKPFVGYHAAVALLAAARKLDASFRSKLQQAIQRARAALADKRDTDRYRTLEEAEQAMNNAASPEG